VKTFPTLYKLDANGSVREWAIQVELIDSVPTYTVIHGMQGGQLQETSTDIKDGKNIGKANETTSYEQCVAEAQSLWNRQKDRKGYSENIPTKKQLRPMLAKKYNSPDNFNELVDGKHITFPCYGQPKLDGVRCLAERVGQNIRLVSRQGKEFKVLKHIELALLNSGMKDGEIYDGELYSNRLNFQEIISAVKRDEPNELTEKIQFWIYDLVKPEWDYKERYDFLITQNIEKQPSLRIVYTFAIRGHDSVVYEHDKWTKKGFEGIMLRNCKGGYEIDKRSSNLQKVKKFFDEDFEIVGAKECKGKLAGMCSFTLKTKEGILFETMPEGTDNERRQLFRQFKEGKLTGKKMNVRFFSWTDTKPPVPRFPIGVEIR
jgi:DNA ligase-1